jgi:cytidylate kinase
LDRGHSPDNIEEATAAAVALDPAKFDEQALKAQTITEAASVVAAMPEVRQALMNYQRQFATKPPGAVLDGRDIGTVIAPGADVKLFVTASPEVRAARRARELQARGERASKDEVLADLLRRDERDSRRTAAPAKTGSRCTLARYHAFGYRRRIPGRYRNHRSRPNGPKAPLTAPSSLEECPFRLRVCGAV